VPQSPQNFFLSILAAPQLGHSMPHPIDWIRAAYHSWRRTLMSLSRLLGQTRLTDAEPEFSVKLPNADKCN
jgi:hypothetical protein